LKPLLLRLVLVGGLSAALYYAIGALPGSGSLELDALVGYLVGVVPLAILAWLVAGRPLSPRFLGITTAAGLVAGLLLSGAGLFGLAAPFKIVAAVSAGCLLAMQLDQAWILFLIAVVALFADTWSVFAGPTKAVVEKAPGVLDYLLIHFASLGTGQPGVALGMSDLVFLGLFTAGCRITGLRTRASFAAMLGSFLVTFAITLTTRRSLPALPLLGLAFIFVNADLLWSRRPRRHAKDLV